MERLRNPYSGLGQYCLQLGRALATEPAAQAVHFECYLPREMTGIMGPAFRYRAVRKWQKITGVETDASLWHCMHQDSAYFPTGKTTVAMTIHDLNFLERTDYSTWRKTLKARHLQQRINRCKGLVYISEFVKKWVHENMEVPAGTIESVIYNGAPTEEHINLGKMEKRAPYLFSIGMHPKKNYAVALPILQLSTEYQWVIAGADSKGYKAELQKAAELLGVADRLVFVGAVPEAEKWRLYKNCAALIFPSLSEGFGMPVLEAMAFGKPVFLSDRTSLPEIGGAEAYYFKSFAPKDVQAAFSEGMEKYKNDPEKPERLKKHAAKFSWDKTAKEYLKFYNAILEH